MTFCGGLGLSLERISQVSPERPFSKAENAKITSWFYTKDYKVKVLSVALEWESST